MGTGFRNLGSFLGVPCMKPNGNLIQKPWVFAGVPYIMKPSSLGLKGKDFLIRGFVPRRRELRVRGWQRDCEGLGLRVFGLG